MIPQATRTADRRVTDECGCMFCRKGDIDLMDPLGKEEWESFFAGTIHERRRRFTCRHCGSRWLHVQESGLGRRTAWICEQDKD